MLKKLLLIRTVRKPAEQGRNDPRHTSSGEEMQLLVKVYFRRQPEKSR